MPNKFEGAKMECGSCGVDLVCHMSKYEGGIENRLQWQNSDGSAHYKWKSTGKYDCIMPEENIETPELSTPTTDEYLKEKQTQITQEVRNFDDKMQKLIVSAYDNKELILLYTNIDRLIALEHIIKSKFEERGIELNAQKIGMYLKIIQGVD